MDTGIKVFFGGLCLTAAILLGVVIFDEATEPEQGKVTGKTYRDAWTQIQCQTIGKSTTCIPIQHPECWELAYINDGATGDACVTEDEYRRYEVGQWYPAGAR